MAPQGQGLKILREKAFENPKESMGLVYISGGNSDMLNTRPKVGINSI
jgi:hypothetical protein